MQTFLSSLVRELDPTASVVECEREPAGSDYRIRLRAARGELTKPLYLPATMLARAHRGDTFAVRSVRIVLKTSLLGVEAQQSRDLSTATRYHRRSGRPPTTSPEP